MVRQLKKYGRVYIGVLDFHLNEHGISTDAVFEIEALQTITLKVTIN